MKVRTSGMTGYPNKPGHWKTLYGTCPTCGKEFWDEFEVDDLYYETWNWD
jgi:hypothetical protein